MKIGIFDSGVGGLSVAREIMSTLGDVDIYYVADKKFAPYGELSEEKIIERSIFCARLLLAKKVDVVIVACNTATAASIEVLREKFSVPFIGVEPDLHFKARENLSLQKDKNVCVLCTSRTFESKKFNELRKRRDPDDELNYVAMKELAGLVENAFWALKENSSPENQDQQEEAIIQHVREKVDLENVSHLVLGCTHYELVGKLLEVKLNVKAVGVSKAIVQRLFSVMDIHPSSESFSDSCRFYFYQPDLDEWQKMEWDKFLTWPKK